MIEGLFVGAIKLLGSAGFGTIFGGFMGFLNRREDAKLQKMKFEHDLALRKADAEIMAQEWAARTKVAEVEGAAKVEAEAFGALAKSYEFAQPDKGSSMASFSSFMRPFMSGGYFVISTLGCGWILYYAFKVAGVQFSVAQWYELVMFVVAWFFFMAGSAIGWWFAMRPGSKAPTLTRA